jgi:hypothetical protein
MTPPRLRCIRTTVWAHRHELMGGFTPAGPSASIWDTSGAPASLLFESYIGFYYLPWILSIASSSTSGPREGSRLNGGTRWIDVWKGVRMTDAIGPRQCRGQPQPSQGFVPGLPPTGGFAHDRAKRSRARRRLDAANNGMDLTLACLRSLRGVRVPGVALGRTCTRGASSDGSSEAKCNPVLPLIAKRRRRP